MPLCLNMNSSTQQLVLRDLVETVALDGIGKFVILNGHGGNDFRQMIREVQAQLPQGFLSAISWFKVLPHHEWFERSGDHADEVETSLMMHLFPELVLPLRAAGAGETHVWRLQALKEGWAWAQRDWTLATEDTGAGDPAPATAEKGGEFFEALTAKIAAYLVELADLKLEDLYEWSQL